MADRVREHSRAVKRDDAVTNIREAIEGCVQVLEEDGLPVPAKKFAALVMAV